MSGRHFTDADGVVVTLDFTDEEVLRDAHIHSVRQTSTSRRPGRKVRGAVHREARERHLVKCECGNYRWSDVVPHAPRWNRDNTHLVDCMGVEVTG